MPGLPEPQSYANLAAIYVDVLTNRSTQWGMFIGACLFFLLQKIGEKVHLKLVAAHRRKKFPKQLLGTYIQSIVHAFGISVASFLVIYHFAHDPHGLVTLDNTEVEYFYIVLYKVCSVLSLSYFIFLTMLEVLVIEQVMIMRLTMVVHHLVSIGLIPIVVMSNPAFALLGALTFQCESSTVFLNLRMLGMAMENKYIYFIGGLGTLITYPITRIVFLVFTIWTTMSLRDVFADHSGIGGFYLAIFAQVFVLCMSAKYSWELWKRPKKTLFLDIGKKQSKTE